MQTRYQYTEDGHRHELVLTLEGGAEKASPLMGTTTIIHEVLPPNLAWWASGMALKQFGWTNPKQVKRFDGIKEAIEAQKKIKKMPGIEYYDYLQKCYRAHDEFKKDAGEYGTEAHAAIETAVKEAIEKSGGYLDPHPYEHEAVERFAQWGRGKMFIHSEVHVYSEELWIGGIVDLVYMEGDDVFLGDVKTSKSMYPSHFIQMGLYDVQQLENGFVDAKGTKVGEPKDIKGYTVINIPRDQEHVDFKTFAGTERLRAFGPNLVKSYKVLEDLKEILK